MVDLEGEDKRVYIKESLQENEQRLDDYYESGDSLFPEVLIN